MECVHQFQHLVDHINGEESNKFTNTLGESVIVTVQDNEDATAELLCSLSFYSLLVCSVAACHHTCTLYMMCIHNSVKLLFWCVHACMHLSVNVENGNI